MAKQKEFVVKFHFDKWDEELEITSEIPEQAIHKIICSKLYGYWVVFPESMPFSIYSSRGWYYLRQLENKGLLTIIHEL